MGASVPYWDPDQTSTVQTVDSQNQNEDGWQIPRPALAMQTQTEGENVLERECKDNMVSMSCLEDDFPVMRANTPTTFTLLSHSGVLRSSYPTSCQLSLTVCALALVTLVAFIVYMEVYMQKIRV